MQDHSKTIEFIFNAKYELQDIIGVGAFSEVRIGIERKTGNQFAIKIIDRSKCKGKEDMIETEVRVLKMIKHENIIQLYEMFEFNGKIFLVMELVTGGELFDEITQRGTFNERDAAAIVQKILSAIKYLHEMGIVHRDLKPENLLLSDRTRNPRVKISDFGLSKIFKETDILKTACGTPGYVAPEILKKKGYGPQVDMWSLGVITYILLCGYPPFFDSSNTELFKKIMAGRFQFDRPWWDNISEKAKDFICKLLIVEPKLRWTAAEALQHPFIIENCYPQRYVSPMDMACRLPPNAIPATTIYYHPTKTIKVTLISLQVPTIIPKHKVKPVQPKMDIDSNASTETVCSKPQVVDQSKTQFSAKVNRIASWFRTATFVERSATKSKNKYTTK
ncbi:hypothetical protein HK103_001233 [Boothiomyces macroporosus]|uniref:Protein kinase domain-containing protein n=1 Tax=Boothiomyces macroporosus TaxID=261099 RepID=A0AAD5UK20_9FUNG|nr:hypothetical protein HK103_001233 [Boothiomyces macroporosus]